MNWPWVTRIVAGAIMYAVLAHYRVPWQVYAAVITYGFFIHLNAVARPPEADASQ